MIFFPSLSAKPIHDWVRQMTKNDYIIHESSVLWEIQTATVAE